MIKRYYVVMTSIFVAMTLVLFLLNKVAPAYNFFVLESCAALIFGLSIIAHMLVHAQINKTPMAFTRGIMGATFLKLMVCMVAGLIYIVMNRDTLFKPNVFIFFGIYAIFSAAETLLLTKIAKTVK